MNTDALLRANGIRLAKCSILLDIPTFRLYPSAKTHNYLATWRHFSEDNNILA